MDSEWWWGWENKWVRWRENKRKKMARDSESGRPAKSRVLICPWERKDYTFLDSEFQLTLSIFQCGWSRCCSRGMKKMFPPCNNVSHGGTIGLNLFSYNHNVGMHAGCKPMAYVWHQWMYVSQWWVEPMAVTWLSALHHSLGSNRNPVRHLRRIWFTWRSRNISTREYVYAKGRRRGCYYMMQHNHFTSALWDFSPCSSQNRKTFPARSLCLYSPTS